MHSISGDHACNLVFLGCGLLNVYDFDGTIYRGDSTVDFYRFCIARHPSVLLRIPLQLKGAVMYKFGRYSKTVFKEEFFSFLKALDNPQEDVNMFWKKHRDRIYDWYLAQKKESDIIISASPEFLLRPVCDYLGVPKLIASRVDIRTGRFNGLNCHGEEKPERLRRETGLTHIDAFYSDSMSDRPMAEIADKAFIVKKGRPEKW